MTHKWRTELCSALATNAVYGLLALAVLVGLARPGRAAAEEPQVSENVRMNAPQTGAPEGRPGRSAEAIAAGPEGRHLVAAWDNVQGFCGPPFGRECEPMPQPGLTGVAYSNDGGGTWVDLGAPPDIDGAITGGRPWLDRGGSDGETVFLVSRARRIDPDAGSSVGGRGQVGITFHRGRFENGEFRWQDGRVLSPRREGDVWRSPAVAAAKDRSGRVYVAIANLRALCGLPSRSAGQIEIVRSLDDGQTWEEPVVIGADATPETPDPKDRLCGLVGALQIAPSVALGPGEEVYVVWPFGPFFFTPDLANISTTLGIRVARSLDGGKIFSYPRDVAYPHSLRLNPPVGFSKDSINDLPRIAVDTTGAFRGRVYVTYAGSLAPASADATEQSPISSQVYLVSSADQGKSWSAPVPLGPPLSPTGTKRIWPTVSVRGGGEVDVVYLESREMELTPDPSDTECNTALVSRRFRAGRLSSQVDVYWVQSSDGGATFSAPLRVTSATSNWCSASYEPVSILFSNFGDYLGAFSVKDRTFAVWTDSRGGFPDAYFASIRGLAAPPREGEPR